MIIYIVTELFVVESEEIKSFIRGITIPLLTNHKTCVLIVIESNDGACVVAKP